MIHMFVLNLLLLALLTLNLPRLFRDDCLMISSSGMLVLFTMVEIKVKVFVMRS